MNTKLKANSRKRAASYIAGTAVCMLLLWLSAFEIYACPSMHIDSGRAASDTVTASCHPVEDDPQEAACSHCSDHCAMHSEDAPPEAVLSRAVDNRAPSRHHRDVVYVCTGMAPSSSAYRHQGYSEQKLPPLTSLLVFIQIFIL